MIAALLAVLVAVALPNPYPTLSPSPELSPPPFPPDGTYTYGLSKDGRRVGSTTVVVERRPSDNRFDIDEIGSSGGVAIRSRAGVAYRDLQPNPWDVTYAGLPLPEAGSYRQKYGAVQRYTVRYEIDRDGSFDVVDGIRGGDVWPLWSMPPGSRHALYWTVFDPPFMSGVMTIPATQALRHEGYVFGLSEALGIGFRERLLPISASAAGSVAPSSDRAFGTDDVEIYYDPKTLVVDAAVFKKSGVTAHLDARSKSTTAAISFGAP